MYAQIRDQPKQFKMEQGGPRWTGHSLQLDDIRIAFDSLAIICSAFFLCCSFYKVLRITFGVLTEGAIVLNLYCFLYYLVRISHIYSSVRNHQDNRQYYGFHNLLGPVKNTKKKKGKCSFCPSAHSRLIWAIWDAQMQPGITCLGDAPRQAIASDKWPERDCSKYCVFIEPPINLSACLYLQIATSIFILHPRACKIYSHCCAICNKES